MNYSQGDVENLSFKLFNAYRKKRAEQGDSCPAWHEGDNKHRDRFRAMAEMLLSEEDSIREVPNCFFMGHQIVLGANPQPRTVAHFAKWYEAYVADLNKKGLSIG